MENKTTESNFIFILKAFALVSIVCAHVSVVPKTTNLFNKTSGLILDSIGSIGVGVFFLISGYLFYYNKKPLTTFSKSKINTIIIPWLFCGTLNFLYVTIRKGGLDLYNWFITLTIYSHMYYLTILIVFYLWFWRLRNEVYYLCLILLLSIVSIILTGLSVLKIYPYINPFNWAIYFIIGILINKYKLLPIITIFSKKKIFILVLTYLLTLIVYISNGTYISYWKYAAILVEVNAIAMLFGLSAWFVNINNNKMLVYTGKMAFVVFLLHMPIAGIVTNVFNRFNIWYLTLARPFIVIFLTIVGIELVRFMLRKLGIRDFFDVLIGLNRSRVKF